MNPARLGQVRLPEGRRLGWAEWGPEEGTPVLLCSGAATSRWLGFGGDVVGQLGIRLLTVDRPGLGASDPEPGRTLDDWARDVRHLAEIRELPGLAVVGFSQGAPFALACAAAGCVSGVAVVSGSDELASPGFREILAPEVRRPVEARESTRRSTCCRRPRHSPSWRRCGSIGDPPLGVSTCRRIRGSPPPAPLSSP
ncbi:MAG TPA: alpha/beta hydrolase [Myxococcaceae bacterium]|nr:alpha/beta hydrolase [Myxococcaceae bacterium]